MGVGVGRGVPVGVGVGVLVGVGVGLGVPVGFGVPVGVGVAVGKLIEKLKVHWEETAFGLETGAVGATGCFLN